LVPDDAFWTISASARDVLCDSPFCELRAFSTSFWARLFLTVCFTEKVRFSDGAKGIVATSLPTWYVSGSQRCRYVTIRPKLNVPGEKMSNA
jgi:hypothetical protein